MLTTDKAPRLPLYKLGYYLLISMRPKQWIKNTFILAPLIFSRSLPEVQLTMKALETFALFSLVSGAIYLINDIADRTNDRLHPRKRFRPVAAGLITPCQAGAFAFMLLLAGLLWAFKLDSRVGGYTLAYIGQALLYSMYLKHMVIIDVFLVASGFVLRVLAGASAIQVPVSAWLLASVTLLSLFLALCKRRQELACLEQAAAHRKSLSDYSLPLLDQLITVVTSSTIVIYALYTSFGAESQYLMLTIPLVLFGLCRYLYLLHQHQAGGEPENLILQDKPLAATILLWVIACLIILYV